MTSGQPELIPLRLLRGIGDLPADRSALRRHARNAGWALEWQEGRGGRQIVVHTDSLPGEVVSALAQVRAGIDANENPDPDLWASYARKPQWVQEEAERDLEIILAFEDAVTSGLPIEEATSEVCSEFKLSRPTLQRMRTKVRGLDRVNWLPALAKNYKGGGRKAEMSEEAWTHCLSFLKESSGRMPLSKAYRKTAEAAELFGWEWPSYGTVRNRWEEVPAGEKALIKSGAKALDKTIPPMSRTVAHLQAMQIVNLDGRKADFFARWEDGIISRPIVIAIQDVYSRIILGYRFAKTEDADTTKAVILDILDRFGLFDELRTDNGRAFASKKVSGGAMHRFRGKKLSDEELGILTLIGVKVGFAKPRRGQSKPIERGFRDVAEQIDTLPEFRGAYCGHRPDAKPEDFTGTPVDMETVRAVYSREIQDHNEQPGRRTEMCKGKLSFSQAFAESYKQRPRRELTQAQRRYFMFDMAYLKPNKDTGALTRNGFTWWSREHQDTLLKHRTGKVCVLFDPNDRSKPVIVQDMKGNLIIESLPCLTRGRFDSTEDARQHERGKAQIKKAARRELEGRKLMTAAQLANMQRQVRDARPDPVPPFPETNISKPLFGAPGMKAKPATVRPESGATVKKLGQCNDFDANAKRGLELLREARKAG